MSVYLSVLIAICNYYLLNKRENIGIVVFAILSIICPRTNLIGMHLSYSYIFIPFLLVWCIIKKKNVRFKTRYTTPILLCLLWTVIISFVNSITRGYPVNYLSLIGTYKAILVCAILSQTRAIKENYLLIFRFIIIANVCVMVIELYLLQTLGAVGMMQIVEDLWGTTGGDGIRVDEAENFGVFRLFGTFATSAYPAILSMIGMTIFWNELRRTNSNIALVSFLCSILCGLGSCSKRFFLGGVLFIVLNLVFNMIFKEKSYTKSNSKTISVIVLLWVALPTVFVFLNDYLALDHYMEFLTNGDIIASTETRFGDDGIVNSMIPVIMNNFITGVGDVAIKNVIVTDSMLYVSMYTSGLIGVFFIVISLLMIYRHIINDNNDIKILYCIILFEFVIGTSFYSDFGVLLLAICTYNNMIINNNNNNNVNIQRTQAQSQEKR